MQIKDRIGILGGTFNPIHLGHLILAQCALESLDLTRLLLVPCAQPPHKPRANLTAAHHRLAMVEQAIEDNPWMEACDLDVRRGGVSYAIDTVRELHTANPAAKFFFLIGTDTLTELHLWKDIYDLLPLCRFVAFTRPGHDVPALQTADLHLDAPWPGRLLDNVVTGRRIEISSSDIRYRVAEGMSIQYLVPQPVAIYIAEHRLYQGG